jgi:hypothetical protein
MKTQHTQHSDVPVPCMWAEDIEFRRMALLFLSAVEWKVIVHPKIFLS